MSCPMREFLITELDHQIKTVDLKRVKSPSGEPRKDEVVAGELSDDMKKLYAVVDSFQAALIHQYTVSRDQLQKMLKMPPNKVKPNGVLTKYALLFEKLEIILALFLHDIKEEFPETIGAKSITICRNWQVVYVPGDPLIELFSIHIF